MSEEDNSSLTFGGPAIAPLAIKRCPFCGEDNAETEADKLQGTKWGRVVCRSCGVCGPEVRTDYEDGVEAPWRAEAIAEWNHRTPHIEDVLAEAACRAVACLKEWRKEGDIADDVSAAIMYPGDGATPDTGKVREP